VVNVQFQYWHSPQTTDQGRQMRIQTIDALAGSLKTFLTIQHAIKEVQNGKRVVIAQPTERLIRESAQTARKLTQGMYCNIKAIHTETTTGTVHQELTTYLERTEPCLLFVTQKTLLNTPYWNESNNWDLYVDELFPVITEHVKTLPDTFEMLADVIDFKAEGKFPEVQATKLLHQIADNRNHDEIFAVIQELTDLIRSKHHSVYVHHDSWNKVLNQQGTQLFFYSMLQPEFFNKFGSITFVGANFKDSQLNLLWQDSVEFKPHEIELSIPNKLPYHEHVDPIQLKYMYTENYSKAKRDKVIRGSSYGQRFEQATQKTFENDNFIWVANRDIKDMFKNSNAERIPNVSHGLNAYQNTHNIAFCSALNPRPPHKAFMKHMGMTDQQIKDSFSNQIVYQAIMRTSIRNPEHTAPKTVVVPDLQAATYLQKLLPTAEVSQIVSGFNEPLRKKPMTPAEKQKAYRERQKQW
jgi:hypothetical protein